MSDTKLILALTACPTGIAHTYMAAEKLQEAAASLGHDIHVETHGSIGVENAISDEEIARADAVVIAADKQIDLTRFAGIPTVTTSVADGIKRPTELIEKALTAPPAQGERTRGEQSGSGSSGGSFGQTIYKALMNGVSHMIPFVVTGGLLIAIALSLGGSPTPEGLQIPDDSFWKNIEGIGGLAFSLMVPVLSGYIAYAIADRPGLVPGMVTGLIAVTGELYGSEAGAGFIGGIVTGFLSGYVALGIKKIPVNKFIAPIWPIIVIPVFSTVIVGLGFVLLLGGPIAGIFEGLTNWLSTMDGSSALLLGAILGGMIAFDMGGPVNKTAFLFAGGLIASGNAAPMGMVAVAIATPPLGMGVASLIRRKWFTRPEQDAGIAALFMGCFGITEGAIPFAAARPLQVIPANVVGGIVGGAVAAALVVKDNVMHGGIIVAVLGAVENVGGFFLALAAGTATTAAVALLLISLTRGGKKNDAAAASDSPQEVATPTSTGGTATATRTASVVDYISEQTVLLDLDGDGPEEAIRRLAETGHSTGQIDDVDAVVATAMQRESEGTTGIGDGIAIPHAKADGVTRPMLAFGRSADGIDWKSMDDAPAHLVFLIAVPSEQAGDEHLRILAALSRALTKQPFREKLLAASSREEVLNTLRSELD